MLIVQLVEFMYDWCTESESNFDLDKVDCHAYL